MNTLLGETNFVEARRARRIRCMFEQDRDPVHPELLLQNALSGWDNEGGAGPGDLELLPPRLEDVIPMPPNNVAELGGLHVRIIALENLVIAMMAAASNRQLQQAREMSSYIAPRAGFTPHPLTTRAAARMVDLIERASRFGNPERLRTHVPGVGLPPHFANVPDQEC
jgi:hypothetical protein